MTMRNLLATTALSIGLAMPAMAQTTDQTGSQTGAQSGQTSESQQAQGQQAQGMTIMVSSLIGRSLYMPGAEGDASGDQSGDTARSGAQSGGEMDDGMSAEEQAEVAEGGAEGEMEELEQGAERAAAEAGQAVENTAEQVGQAAENAWDNLAREVTEAPENWQMVGDIDDVVVSQDGEVRALVVDAGGFLGAGEQERRIDIENVRFVQDSDDEGEYFVVFAGDRSMFEEQENFDQAQAEQEGEMLASENEEFQSQIAAEGRGPQDDLESVDWASITTEDVLGAPVYGRNDEWIGDLSEFNLASDGTIESVIIDVGGFLGLGEKPVEMSLDQVTLRRYAGDEIRAYVDATEADLDAMPEWEGSDL
ncbi:PRC-barrel domain-containing protein [Roseibacterium sp. SDUM158017]|uniref:PRC-barrel domain-containing protein n=1 Tax=Roseicyclus salinarum TaxID=3036773 RepID=UPI00241549B8|nr:PRC-barrel domain-containing protein [Roseibacterium sp. SDUM158017]MDG4650500.1 PRC-barrel domain-containing protein [Roseibacterium sp. SDUM158017]